MDKPTVLLLIDVINDCDFEGGEELVANAEAVLEPIVDLAARCRAAGVPVVYVNDNYGCWSDSFADIVAKCTREGSPGAKIARALRPQEGDHFILKPKHSAFYLTSLDAFLAKYEMERLIMCGFAGDICVLFTANDAHMREYEVIVPRDGIASESTESNEHALAMMRKLSTQTPLAAEVVL